MTTKQKQIAKTPTTTPKTEIIVVDDSRLTSDNGRPHFTDIVQQVVSEAQFVVLTGKTPAHAIRYKPKGGRNLPYVPHGYVRDILNKAFGWDWDFRIMTVFNGMPYECRDAIEGKKEVKQLTVLGELTVRIRDPNDLTRVLATIVKQEFGALTLRAEMEFGDCLKGASSDALKRCGTSMGIALDLYYNDEVAVAGWEQRQRQNEMDEEVEKHREAVEKLRAEGVDDEDIAEALQIKYTQVKAVK